MIDISDLSSRPTGYVGLSDRLGSDILHNKTYKEAVINDFKSPNGSVFRQIVDKLTGEVIKEYWVNETDKPIGRPPGGKRAYFFKLYTTNWRDIVSNKRLTPYEAGVFSMLIAYLDWQSPYIVHPKTKRNMSESEIANELKISRSQLHDTLQSLVDKGMIAKVNKGVGRECHFMLNTNVCFNGNTIQDINDHVVFLKDCAYKPVVEIKYRETQNK